MSDKTTTTTTTAAPNLENTVYAPTVTRALTPEEAAHNVVETPPASSIDRRQLVQPAEFPTIERTVEGSGASEVVNPEPEEQGFPIGFGSDEDYKQALEDSSVDYTQTVDETDEDETLEK